MGLFSGMNLPDAPDSPFEAPVGTWRGVLTAVETFSGKKDPSAEYLKFEFTEGEGNGTFDHICVLPVEELGEDDPENKKRRSRIKQVLNSLEIPPEDMDTLDEQKLVGTPVVVTTFKNTAKNGNVYINLRSLTLDYGDEVPTTSSASSSSSAAAPSKDPWDFSNI